VQRKLEEFYEVLKKENIELDEVELAEVVWLATQISEESEGSLVDMLKKRLDDILGHIKFDFFNKKMEKDKTLLSDKPLVEVQKPKKRRVEKRSNSAPLVASSSETENTLPFRTPVNNYLHKSNEWIHVFRHFKQKKQLDDKQIFDEEKTADYFASSRIFVPQYKVSYEKRFEAIFLVDVSDSMEIWKELIDDFFKSIKSYGVFKKVTVYYLHSNSGFELYKADEKRGKLNKSWYRNREDESLCFVLTDMLSQGWQDGAWLSSFEKWQSKFALSMVQMLPYHLWKGTILNRAMVTKFEGEKVFGKNKYLKSRGRVRDVNEKILKLPILNLDTNSFDKYGKVFLAKGKQYIDGAIFKVNKNYESKEKIKTLKTDAQRVEHFYKIASEEAIALAEYFSVIPLIFPVMKIVQEILLPDSTQVHLSEVFMSGLINKKHKLGDIYSFYDSEKSEESVREILLNLLGTSKAVETIVSISNYVSSTGGQFSFLAFLQDSNYLEKGGVSSEFDREFARISATLLEKMGGEYAKKANELIEFIEYEEEELTHITPTRKRFDDKKEINEILTPRSVVFALEGRMTIKEVMETEPNIFKFSRIPIYNKTLEDVRGIVLTKKIFQQSLIDDSISISTIQDHMDTIHESLSVIKAIDLFIKKKQHMFLVLDSYDQIEGILTLEDCVKTLLGIEIMDESDTIEDMRELVKINMKIKRRKERES